MKRYAARLCALVVALCATGCGKKMVQVEGAVTLDGKPVEGAVVSFARTDRGAGAGSGMTDASGVFRLSTRVENDGITPGEYVVTVRKVLGGAPGSGDTGPVRHVLPLVYGEPGTTPLRCNVPHNGLVKLDLTSPAK